MKLDYLQFLELEAFTRFGQRLEASMEQRIKRGRLLRELLKQDQLTPLSSLFQLAWLTAFNNDLLNSFELQNVGQALERIAHGIVSTDLTLDSPPELWQHVLPAWLASE
jgi:F-type H+-transporting ATPase subunit alpha